jgi:hypothetical protein
VPKVRPKAIVKAAGINVFFILCSISKIVEKTNLKASVPRVKSFCADNKRE